MATTSAIPRPRELVRPGLTLAMVAALGWGGLGCSSFGSNAGSGGGLFSFASANPYDEPAGISTWINSKRSADDLGTPVSDAERTAMDDKARHDLDIAKRLYFDKSYAQAEAKFNLIAKAKKLPVDVQEDAIFYRGECQRLQANYRSAEGSLKLYIKSFPYGKYTAQANERLFDIANY